MLSPRGGGLGALVRASINLASAKPADILGALGIGSSCKPTPSEMHRVTSTLMSKSVRTQGLSNMRINAFTRLISAGNNKPLVAVSTNGSGCDKHRASKGVGKPGQPMKAGTGADGNAMPCCFQVYPRCDIRLNIAA